MATTSYESNGRGPGDRPNGRGPLDPLQDGARAAMQGAREQGNARFEEYRDTAADQLEALADSARAAGDELSDKDTLGVSHYISDMAQSMGSLADGLRGKSADQLLQQAGRLARDNPALFLAGSIAVGFGLSRLLRASSAPETEEPDYSLDSRTEDLDQGWRSDDVVPVIAADEGLAVPPSRTDDTFGTHPSRAVPGGFDPLGQSGIRSPDSLGKNDLSKGDLE